MDLPADKGTYILIVQVSKMKRLAIGSLGELDIIPGFYAYVGSAFGSGRLRARIGPLQECSGGFSLSGIEV